MSRSQNRPKAAADPGPEQARQHLEAVLSEVEQVFVKLEDLDRQAREKFAQWRESQDRESFDQRNAALDAARALFLALGPLIQRAARALEVAAFWGSEDLSARFDEILVLLPPPEEYTGPRSVFGFLRELRGLLLKAIAAGESPNTRESARVPPPGTGKLLAPDHPGGGNGQPQTEAPALAARNGAPVRSRLLSTAEAADYLGRTKEAVEHMIASGKLPRVRADRRVFLDRRDLDEWIEANKG